jgi:hypothetical protein
MIVISDTERRRALSVWLRTGRWPTITIADDVEIKFNSWHDPADGRFIFAGAGRNYGRGGAKPIGEVGGHAARISRRSRLIDTNSSANTKSLRSREAAVNANSTSGLATTAMPVPKQKRRGTKPSPTTEFLSGTGEGLYRAGKETVAGGYSLLTTNPVTTVSNAAIGFVQTIDSVLAAENTSTLVHIDHAVGRATWPSANADANPSERLDPTGEI